MMGHSESENKKREGGKKEGGKEEGQDHSHIAQKRSDQFCIDDCMHAGEGGRRRRRARYVSTLLPQPPTVSTEFDTY